MLVDIKILTKIKPKNQKYLTRARKTNKQKTLHAPQNRRFQSLDAFYLISKLLEIGVLDSVAPVFFFSLFLFFFKALLGGSGYDIIKHFFWYLA